MWTAIRHYLGLHQFNGIISWCEINEEATETMYERTDGLKVGTGKLVAPSPLKLLIAH